jgi:hypothetical protein
MVAGTPSGNRCTATYDIPDDIKAAMPKNNAASNDAGGVYSPSHDRLCRYQQRWQTGLLTDRRFGGATHDTFLLAIVDFAGI